MRILDVKTLAVLSDLHGSKSEPSCSSPDGDRIAMYRGRDIQLWVVNQGKLIAKFTRTKHVYESLFWQIGVRSAYTGCCLVVSPIRYADADEYSEQIWKTWQWQRWFRRRGHYPNSDLSLPFKFVGSAKENTPLFLLTVNTSRARLCKDWTRFWMPRTGGCIRYLQICFVRGSGERQLGIRCLWPWPTQLNLLQVAGAEWLILLRS
jgi:hypothetical protein